jgi:hypothetical protein
MRSLHLCKTARAAFSLALFAVTTPSLALAAFTDVGQVNPEIARTDPSIIAWSTAVTDIHRGYRDYQQPALGFASFGNPTDVLGSSGTACSLGDGGSITLTFAQPISNGPGADFVVFENGFAFNGGVYAEMGFVEVSSDGTHFARLPALCRNTAATGSFDAIHPADYYNVGGNYVGGTGIDLQDLVTDGDPLVLGGQVDINHIFYVRLVDVVGDVVGPGRTFDYFGRPVSDPYPTAFASSGMDVSGVGVIHQSPPTATLGKTWGTLKAQYR